MLPLRGRSWIARLASPRRRSDLVRNRLILLVAPLQSQCANAGSLPFQIELSLTQGHYGHLVRPPRAVEDGLAATKNRLARRGFRVARFYRTARLRTLDTRCDS